MLNNSEMKVYINAYIVRMDRGEVLEDIDNSYKKIKRLTDSEIKDIHKRLKELEKI